MVVGSTNNRVKWYFVLILVVVITTSIDLITRSYMVSAENDDMSWTDGPPSKIKTTTVDRSTFYVYQPCPLNITVYGEYYPATACVDSNESIKFAIYTVDQKYYRAAVSFRNDSTMYPVDLDCNDDLCTYMPDTDTLVIKQRKGNNLYGLVVYKNFTSRLTRHIDTVSMTTDRYTFNFNNPSYELKDSNNFYWSVGTVTPSDNGKYLAVELYNKGVAVLDVNNLTMKYVTGRAFEYWRGFDPSIEFAITNDGKHLAETGMNAGFCGF